MIQDILNACAAQGHKTDAAGTVSGLTEGIAFRAELTAGALQLSVNVPAENLPRLQKRLAEHYADVQLAPSEGYGIRLTMPSMADMRGDAFIAFLQKTAQLSLDQLHDSFNDRFETDRESFTRYLAGVLGALLGAIVGVLPWFLTSTLLGWQSGFLAFFVSAGAFFGYQFLRGAHSTSFAVGCIAVCSLLAMFAASLLNMTLDLTAVYPAMTLLDAIRFCLQDGLVSLLSDMLFGIVFAALGLVGIRGKVQSYTHETGYLRRGRRRK